MGTNYYVATNKCVFCDRYDERHVCKSLVNWQAHVDWSGDEEKVVLGSWAEWRDFLHDEADEIRDEYGKTYTVDEFVAMVERTDPANRCRQHHWMVEHYPDRISDGPAVGKDWLDADGFSFTTVEFT